MNNVFSNSLNLNNQNFSMDQSLIFESQVNNNSKKTNDTSSACSSRTSNTEGSNNDDNRMK